ncbi:MAG: chemotaxis protein CheW [Nitrospirota bacterium]
MSLFSNKKKEVQATTAAKQGAVSFVLGEKEYAVDIGSVREVIYGKKINPLPSVPDYFAGLIDLRGTIIPVIHLGKRLQAAGQGGVVQSLSDELAQILIVEIHYKRVGFIVDLVSEVVAIEKNLIQSAKNLIEQPLPVIEGVFRYKERLILLLCLERLFTEAVFHQMTEAAQLTV